MIARSHPDERIAAQFRDLANQYDQLARMLEAGLLASEGWLKSEPRRDDT
jgi:hypothetical protein